MMRPQSIVQFERLYVVSIGISVLNNLIYREKLFAIFRNTEVADAGPPLFIGITVLGIMASLALCYLAARRRSNIAKWLTVVLCAISGIGIVSALVRPSSALDLSGMLSIVRFLVQAMAVRQLFRAESRHWFRGEVSAVDSSANESGEGSNLTTL